MAGTDNFAAVSDPAVPQMAVADSHPATVVMRRHPIFTDFTPEQLQRLLQGGRVEALRAGQLLYSRGEPSLRFFLVLDGQVNLSLHSLEGAEKIIDLQGPGEVFAEAVAFMERPVYQMTAVAATAARVVSFQNQAYLEILRENPDACLRVLRHLSSRLHLRIREIEGIALASATARCARLLESRLPAGATESATVHLQETRQELASYLAIKPETLSRALRALADSGAVVVRGRSIDVVDRDRLRLHFDDPGGLRPGG